MTPYVQRADAEFPRLRGEFERYVQGQVGSDASIVRLGAEIVISSGEPPTDTSPLVPNDYILGPGDEVIVSFWGSIDADLRLVIDRTGRIAIPRVGAIQLSGVRYGDLADLINRRVSQVFKNFQSSVALGQLRGIRVFVTGHAFKPGSYTISSLSSVIGAVMKAGGPAPSGSFRVIELRRGNDVITRVDLYDLLVRGDRSADRILQSGDVVHIGPVGVQVGVIGSVNRPAVVELKPGETVADALRYVGSFSAVADRTRLAIERLRDRNAGKVEQIQLPLSLSEKLADGDVIRVFSAIESQLSSSLQRKRVRVEGEVLRPGEYVLAENATASDAVQAAGGLMSTAYLPALEFTRESVRRRQQESYDRALRDLETDLARANASRRVSSQDDVAVQSGAQLSASRLIDQLRTLRPSGRIVMHIGEKPGNIPDIVLEDGDRLFVPPRPTTVGVFGSVFNAASYLFLPDRSLGDYVSLAGGPTKGADEASIFVVRANGMVVSTRQQSGGWFSRSGDVRGIPAQPGDTVFVPEEMDKTTFMQIAKDWTQVLYQFGIGLAGLRSVTR